MADSTDTESGRKAAEKKLDAEFSRLGRTGHCLGVILVRSRGSLNEALRRLLAGAAGPCDAARDVDVAHREERRDVAQQDCSFALTESVGALFLPDMGAGECLRTARSLSERMAAGRLSGTLAASAVPGGMPGSGRSGGAFVKRLLGAVRALPDDGAAPRLTPADLCPAPGRGAIVQAEEKLFLLGGAACRTALRGTSCRKH